MKAKEIGNADAVRTASGSWGPTMSDLATQQPRVAGPSSKRSPKFKPPRVPASLTNGPWPTLEGPEKERRPKRQPYGEKDAGDEALLRGRHLKALLFAHGGFMSARLG